jgi:putative acetyltransferase
VVRKATQEDLDFIYGLYMHPNANPFLLYEQMGKEEFKPIFDDLLRRDIKYIYESEAVPVGMFKLVPNVYRASHVVYLGGLAVHPSFAGKGHGSTMMNEIIQYSAQQGFLRIELSVAVSNVKSQRLYEKAGFGREGILRRLTYLRSENKMVDEVMMSWLSEKIK